MCKIKVSVICNTYNQESYIRTTLKGILAQKTNYMFEVLIHDDASTDGTPEIIHEFVKLYPNIIKPIYQKENQYSKGVSVTNEFQLPRAKGEYIAFCEGDDFWTDPYKLQLQTDLLEKNSQVDICAHAVSIVRNGKIRGKVRPFNHNLIVSPEQVILNGGSFVGTCSIIYRRSIDYTMPEFRQQNSIDYTIQIHGSLHGGLLYLDRNMACYRIGSDGSWTNRVLHNSNLSVKHYDKMIQVMEKIDQDTNLKFTNVINFVVNEYRFKKYDALNQYNKMLEIAKKLRYWTNKDIYCMYRLVTRFKIGIKYQFPILYDLLHKK